ncbi:MAG: segregation/condensation protein A, partial [Scardovia wiggsiae]|nr:segregation/condensation protein A [Scardovia wiggsiae]
MALEETGISSGFTVSLDAYQGPFDALLSLLAQKKLELSEISLALITEDFLSYVSKLDIASDADQVSS